MTMTMDAQRAINAGLADLTITNDVSAVQTWTGSGSCINLCIYDPVKRMGGLVNMLLPFCRYNTKSDFVSSRYINTGAPLLIERMLKQGAQKQNLIAKIAGGARLLSSPGNSHEDIGQKNISEVKAALSLENLPLCGADVGGGSGRSIRFYIETGNIKVKTVSGQVIDL